MKLSALFLQFNESIIISEFKSKKKLFEKDYLLLRREYKPLDKSGVHITLTEWISRFPAIVP